MILDDMLKASFLYKKNMNRAAPPRAGRVLSTAGLGDEIGVELANIAERVQKNNPFTVTNLVKLMDGTKQAETEMEKDMNKIFDLDCPVTSVPEWPGAYIPPTILPFSPDKYIKVRRMSDKKSDSISKPVPFTLGSRGDILGTHTSSEIDRVVMGQDDEEDEDVSLETKSVDSPPSFSK